MLQDKPNYGREQAALSRAHNDSNMLILGSGFVKPAQVLLICGGDEGSQTRDIETARAIWNAYRKG